MISSRYLLLLHLQWEILWFLDFLPCSVRDYMTKVIYTYTNDTLYGLTIIRKWWFCGKHKLQLNHFSASSWSLYLQVSPLCLHIYIKELVLDFFYYSHILKHLTLIFLFTSVSMFFFFLILMWSLSLSWVYITVRVERKQ